MMGFGRTVDLKLKDYIGKRQKNYGVGTKCVFGRRGKMMGFGQTVDLKLVEIIKVKGRKIMG